ncbi:MAG: hypothetical protein LKG20_10060 [Tetrasphaera jenkinsii]|jgi:hypothetical protein|uniref:Putative lantibiotic biosynthesis protein n=1 Tax=Nostocoides jenkinsii Ben 74 TaxID=1193518 RepID=A0A077M4M1_9MICO|nr:lantibiotic dehydratase C-terminal domain-containing protein [Tetrasphaera jenkinsii]MCI1262600.1 hypothetical protein [Tetrasphaera jenkinsii]CCI52221.1 putative lantibiotic biosynthesis protein [Tetrasphaera jenkinsii Ben 74]
MTAPAPWQAHHIFYTAQSRPVLTECVGPLVRSFRERGLIHRYFFINYWLEGPHVRLRFQPTNRAVAAQLLAETESAIAQFLSRRPALYSVQADFFVDMQNTLLDLEFTPAEKVSYLDSKGGMRQRDNNTFSQESYEPEYAKYGGHVGVELAEWHFEKSSDLVIEADSSMNVHVRSVQLGLAGQLMLVMASAFLHDPVRIHDYMVRYHEFWKRGFESTSFIREMEYEQAADGISPSIIERYDVIDGARRAGDADSLPPLLATWLDHCVDLRQRICDLAEAGELIFPEWESGATVAATPEQAVETLLFPYMHMTNNRLQVTLGDEAYLAFVLARALAPDEELTA